MSYGGIDEVEIDEEYGYYYVHRDNGTWNRYSIEGEQGFLNWIFNNEENGITTNEIIPEAEQKTYEQQEQEQFSSWKW